MTPFLRSLPAFSALLLLAACEEQKIVTYRIPKEAPSEASPGGASRASNEVTWTLPEGWAEQAATPPRFASFVIEGEGDEHEHADLSVTPFPGDAGGDLANVNRWRGQLNLPPVSPEELASSVQKIMPGGQEVTIVELHSPEQKTRVLGAIAHQSTKTWFFKLTGPEALVAAHKARFLQFLESLKFASAEGAALGPRNDEIALLGIQLRPVDYGNWLTEAGFELRRDSAMLWRRADQT